MTSQGLVPARGMLVLVVIAQENFDSGHFELFSNFPGRWLLRAAFLADIKPCDVIMHKVYYLSSWFIRARLAGAGNHIVVTLSPPQSRLYYCQKALLRKAILEETCSSTLSQESLHETTRLVPGLSVRKKFSRGKLQSVAYITYIHLNIKASQITTNFHELYFHELYFKNFLMI
jgi:hypothetical protein